MAAPAAPAAWEARCRSCAATSDPADLRWCCPCGGLLDLEGPPGDPAPGLAGPWSLWRYAAALPPWVAAAGPAVTLGEGLTPLIAEAGVEVKLDWLLPSLSFKDRGAVVLAAALVATGRRSAVVDSSGNAGAAMAAFAARAGIALEVFVPQTTAPAKQAAIRRYGATLVVGGDRSGAARAALARVEETGAVYASHVYQPLFVHGTKTLAFELWEQRGGRLPATVVLPAGNGTLVLGADRGFRELVAAGRADRLPRLVAVQAERCAPLAGRPGCGPTVAEGIAIAEPPRADQIRAALAASGGRVITAAEDDIGPARAELAGRGMDVEPTAAAVWAAWRRHGADLEGPTVVVLGGAGAKSP